MSDHTLEHLQVAIAERYLVERELGRGGMATVFLATDVRHDRQVAIKVLHSDLSATIGKERFEREIKLAARLQHPHILGLYDSGEANGLLYYVMPFVEGESVRDKLDREKQLSVDEALQITLEVADALGYAHNQGIVHRDIKPENVMMSNGHALVADFGIARARTEAGQSKLTQTGMAVGTPVYMSPEQSTGETVTPTADIYSLGCMLYEMLAGEPPFGGPNAIAIMAKHAMEAVPSVRVVRPSVPEEVEEAILAALEKSPADRPRTAAEFCEILGTPLGATATRRVTMRYTATRRASSAQVPAFQPPVRPLWRRPSVIAGTVAGVGVLGAGLWMALSGPSETTTVGRAFEPTKIAVMYFEDRSGGDLAYLADGLTEGLIDQLRRVRDLDVLSKDAVGRFRGVSVDSVITALEPGTIVQGSLRESGDRIRFSVNVTDGNTGAERGDGLAFELPADDELALRRNFADSVSLYLRNFVGDVVRARQLEAGTSNAQAWNLVQRAEKLRKDAVAAASRRDTIRADLAFAQADSILQQAEALDPQWASPAALRANLALNMALAARSSLLRAPLVDQGIRHANRALRLDSTNTDALVARGQLQHALWQARQESDSAEARGYLEAAEADLREATSIDPTRATAWVRLSAVRAQLFEPLGSYEAARRAYAEDAYASNADAVLFQMYATAYDLEQFPAAQAHCDEGGRRFPRAWLFVSCKLLMRLSGAVPSGPDSAWRELETLARLVPEADSAVQVRRHRMFAAAALVQQGLVDSARRVVESARAGRDIDPRGQLLTAEALIRIRLGTPADTAIAFDKLREYVIGQRAHGRGFANTNHWWWKGLRDDPRWNRYLREGVGS